MQALPVTTEKHWDRLCDHFQAPLGQRWIYGAAAARLGRRVERIAVMHGDVPVALSQTVSRKYVGVHLSLSTGGPLLCPSVNKETALSALKQPQAWPHIFIGTPNKPLGKLPLSKATSHCILDISQDLDRLRANLHGKWRNALRKAEKAGVKSAQVQPRPQALMPLLAAEKQRQAQVNYRAIPPEFTLALQEVAPRSLRLFEVLDAQMLFLKHGNSATYHIGHTGPQGRAINAHNLILWQAIKVLKSQGVTRLYLGSIDPQRAASLARFKLRTGAEVFRGFAAHLM
ncbi:hypothetical protein EDD53_0959 [Pacificibacter maritimus]|uniref:Acetyltransferase (GNAT) family protein n=2 Tax=Pacificibacter maritimus TaxID=762213 RepID=A0A3N4UWD1_9RHOB|nr:hypothetical protein EDD53_0959 [Pacificibacter maritimus]